MLINIEITDTTKTANNGEDLEINFIESKHETERFLTALLINIARRL